MSELFKAWKYESKRTNTLFQGPLLSLRIKIIDEVIRIEESWNSIWDNFSWYELVDSLGLL